MLDQLSHRDVTPKPAWTGVVRHLHITPRAFLPMRAMPSITLVAGKGIEGDRYMIGSEAGFYSHKPEEGRQVTLFELETLVALKRDHRIELGPEEHRRNVTVEGVPLTHLVGRR
ncbi:MAG: MOSC domain-containing protein, partial [Bradyrhizobium sp.]